MAWQPPSTICPNASLETSYSYLSRIPASVLSEEGTECILGVDEAGRGPVLGPMVYGVSYSSAKYANQIKAHGFMDSKVLDHKTRQDLLSKISDSDHELFREIGWTVRVMSARDIGAGMLKPIAPYNLNAQAHDTTIQLIRDVLNQGVNVRKIFVDTVGIPEQYQAKLQREFPMAEVTVCKKADSIFPIVSVASICAKVTRDKALELAAPSETIVETDMDENKENEIVPDRDSLKATASTTGTKKRKKNQFDSDISDDDEEKATTTDFEKRELQSCLWGSGYPSDARTQNWLKANKNPIFGWSGAMVRYSWSTAKDLLEGTSGSAGGTTRSTREKHKTNQNDHIFVDWHEAEEVENGQQVLCFGSTEKKSAGSTVNNCYGHNIALKRAAC